MGCGTENPQSSHRPQESRKELSASAIYDVGIGTLDEYADVPVSFTSRLGHEGMETESSVGSGEDIRMKTMRRTETGDHDILTEAGQRDLLQPKERQSLSP
jgi:hypothetical protein